MKNKKLIIILMSVLLIIISITFYFVFIKEDKDTKKNNEEIKEENNLDNEIEENELLKNTVKIDKKFDDEDEYPIKFKIEKEIEGLFDEYINTDFSLKKSVSGSGDSTTEASGITAKVDGDKVLYTANDKTIKVENIGTPISLRVHFDVTGSDDPDYEGYLLYVLNSDKELYRIEICTNKNKVYLKEKVEENVDAFNFIEGNNMILTYSEGQNLITITKSGENIKVNGIDINDYDINNIIIHDSIKIGKEGNEFAKLDNKEIVVKGIFFVDNYNYLLTLDNELIIGDHDFKKLYKKQNKVNNIEIKDNELIITYDSNLEETLELDKNTKIYYDGKIYDIK